jgi:succinyl-CoA synthetase alpha subunit
MSLFIDRGTRVLVQGITGQEGAFWTRHMIEMGTRVTSGVTPGKGGMSVGDVPVFDTVQEACRSAGADAAVLFVPPRMTKDAVFEALDSGIRRIVTIAEGIPVRDALQIRRAARDAGALVIGGNTSGVITPGEAMLGVFPYWIERVYRPGSIGVMTRSGSLTNEVTSMVVAAGFGVSTLFGVGGDTVPCTRFAELLPLFEQDERTEAVVVIGELGGSMEEEVADAVSAGVITKPVVGFIGGVTAPEGRQMGHAGAIASGSSGSAREKVQRLNSAGVRTAQRPREVGLLLAEACAK